MQIHVLEHTHRHGTDLYTCLTLTEMDAQILELKRKRWDEVVGGIAPVDDDEFLDAYALEIDSAFDAEGFHCHTTTIQGLPRTKVVGFALHFLVGNLEEEVRQLAPHIQLPSAEKLRTAAELLLGGAA